MHPGQVDSGWLGVEGYPHRDKEPGPGATEKGPPGAAGSSCYGQPGPRQRPSFEAGGLEAKSRAGLWAHVGIWWEHMVIPHLGIFTGAMGWILPVPRATDPPPFSPELRPLTEVLVLRLCTSQLPTVPTEVQIPRPGHKGPGQRAVDSLNQPLQPGKQVSRLKKVQTPLGKLRNGPKASQPVTNPIGLAPGPNSEAGRLQMLPPTSPGCQKEHQAGVFKDDDLRKRS